MEVEALWRRLEQVLDPELDASIVHLGFVEALRVDGGHVTVELHLPTYWCAPGFVFLMGEDIRQALLAAPGVRSVAIRVRDHFASEALEAALNAGRPFAEAFPREVQGSLEELRDRFRRKGYLGRQLALLQALKAAGFSPHEILGLRLGDLDTEGGQVWVRRSDGARVAIGPAELLHAYRRRRRELGISDESESLLMVDPDGNPLSADQLGDYIRKARLTLLNFHASAFLCQALLSSRKAWDEGLKGGEP